MPYGKGLWPALWLLPNDGSWPPEYDILEVLGHDQTTVYQTSHWSDANGVHQSQGYAYKNVINTSTGFHVFCGMPTTFAGTWMVC